MIKKIRDYILVSLLFILIAGNVFLTVGVSTKGAEITQIQNKESVYLSETESINSQMLTNSSLTEIGKKAETLGFSKPQNIVYIKAEEPVAKLP